MENVIDQYRHQFHRHFNPGVSSNAAWLRPVRERAFERFAAQGFPSTSDEEYRFTNLAPLLATPFAFANGGGEQPKAPGLPAGDFPQWQGTQLVFVNGRWDPTASRFGELPSGVVVVGMREALVKHQDRLQPLLEREWGDEETAFHALNHAFVGDGAFVWVPRNVSVAEPIHLRFVASSSADEPMLMSHPFNVIVAEPGSSVTVLESYEGRDDQVYLTNVVTEILAEDNAHVDHYKLQREGQRAFHTAWLSAAESRDASVANHSIALGARLARNDVRCELRGPGASCELNGLYVVKGEQLVDHHTVIDHVSSHCTSRELYKGVLDDASRAVFNGRIVVRPDAQKTDSEQSNKNLLLSKNALVNSNPQLEIHADDVKCAHGATIGQLSPEAMFYLRSRGLGQQQARDILTQGFVNDVNQRLRLSALREELERVLFGANESVWPTNELPLGGVS